MRPKNYSSGWGVLARGTQPEPPTKLLGEDKAQNDVRLASNVGHGVAADTPDANLVLTATEGVRRPS